MAVYSHSKLSSFEQCKYRYKLRYIDKIKAPIEKSIEAHLGTCVHDSLEWLYNQVIKKNIPELDQVIEKYSNRWQEDFVDTIHIVKKELSAQDYFDKGVKFIIDYYMKHTPFQDGTLEMEKKIWVTLHPSSPHKIIGYIDRLVYNKESGEYEIHDYKTAKSIPNRDKIEKDRQLALYSIAIKQLYGEDKTVLLTWHYLSHNMRIDSRRTNKQLEQLKEDIITLIAKIERTKEFPCTKSVLCDWCEYKPYCKAFGNSLPEEFKEKDKQVELNLEKTDSNLEEKKLNLETIKKAFPTASKYLK